MHVVEDLPEYVYSPQTPPSHSTPGIMRTYLSGKFLITTYIHNYIATYIPTKDVALHFDTNFLFLTNA